MSYPWYSNNNYVSYPSYSSNYSYYGGYTNPRYGRTGLSNIGNTCYMNTALQVTSYCGIND